jgi:hypothetical protein
MMLVGSCFLLVPCLAYPSTLTMETTCSSETSVDFGTPVLKVSVILGVQQAGGDTLGAGSRALRFSYM